VARIGQNSANTSQFGQTKLMYTLKDRLISLNSDEKGLGPQQDMLHKDHVAPAGKM
jgi:hypothetical protein